MIKSVGIVGMGALGLLYANWILENSRDITVDFIMDENRLQRNLKSDYTINQQPVKFNLVAANEAKPYDLLIVAVKATALASALNTMKNAVNAKTTIISVLNGITSEEIIGQRYDSDQVLYAIAQGMDAVKMGTALTYSKRGHLLLGIKNLEEDLAKCIQKIGIVRYNAFKDTGSDLSFALALLDDKNNGVVLNGIYSREMSNIYAKPVKDGVSSYTISEEEKQAIEKAVNSDKIIKLE